MDLLSASGSFPVYHDRRSGVFHLATGGSVDPHLCVSTYDTDYVLIKKEHREKALSTLTTAGHELPF